MPEDNSVLESLISFAELSDRLPRNRNGKKVHFSTLIRWATVGRRGQRLEAHKMGGRWYTTWAAFEKFTAAVTLSQLGPSHTSTRSGTFEDVERKLNAAGWMPS